MNEIKYGKLESEKTAEENELCRNIIKEISRFGISERQKVFLIYLLALELENVEHLRNITDVIKEISNENLFLSNNIESNL